MKEKREIVYLKADRNSVCHDPKIKIQDVMSVQCADSAICAGIKNKTLYTFKKNDDQKKEGKKKNSYIIEGLFLPLQTEKRLEALGMTKGTPVEVLNRKRSGTMIVRVRGTRFALGRGITGKIEVAEDKKQ